MELMLSPFHGDGDIDGDVMGPWRDRWLDYNGVREHYGLDYNGVREHYGLDYNGVREHYGLDYNGVREHYAVRWLIW